MSNQRNLPAKASSAKPPVPVMTALRNLELTKGLPPASIVYGSAAGAFTAFSLYLFVERHWVEGFLTLLPGAIFLGFAVHIMNHTHPPR
jgi:hypothetical protein